MTKNDIIHGIRELGVQDGDIIMVHSALSSLGRVEGGANAVIDALIEAVGPTGTIAMPTLYPPCITDDAVFDVKDSPSDMGVITEVFRTRPGVVRSLHPTHPTAAYGARAGDLIRDHAKAPTACGADTPFGRLAEWGGKVLLMGVDQDRNTLLHTAEDYADCAFLAERTFRYRDPLVGDIKKITLDRFPGPHRNFIGLDPLFRKAGIMKVGKIGKAVCRLMDAGETVRIATEALKADPSTALCDNPACADCVRQRGFVRKAFLDKEDFTLSVRVNDVPDLKALASLLWRFGITAVEVGPTWLKHIIAVGIDAASREIADVGLSVTSVDVTGIRSVYTTVATAKALKCSRLVIAPNTGGQFTRASEAASGHRLSLLVRNDRHSKVSASVSVGVLKGAGAGLAFDPAEFAAVGEMPFLQVYYHGIPKSIVRQLYVKDGMFDGTPTELGLGNGEVKELISILRCRSFNGPMVIWPRESIASSCEAFWRLIGSL